MNSSSSLSDWSHFEFFFYLLTFCYSCKQHWHHNKNSMNYLRSWDLPSLLSLCWPLNSGLVMSIWSVSSCKTPGVFQLWNRFFLLIRCTYLVWKLPVVFWFSNSSNLLVVQPACSSNFTSLSWQVITFKPSLIKGRGGTHPTFLMVIKLNIMHIYCDFHWYIKSIIRY